VPPPPPVESQKKQKLGWGAKKPSVTPLSVEELIRKKKEADAATSKVRAYPPGMMKYLTQDLVDLVTFTNI
jgi:hypothetical protein